MKLTNDRINKVVIKAAEYHDNGILKRFKSFTRKAHLRDKFEIEVLKASHDTECLIQIYQQDKCHEFSLKNTFIEGISNGFAACVEAGPVILSKIMSYDRQSHPDLKSILDDNYGDIERMHKIIIATEYSDSMAVINLVEVKA